MSFRVTTSQGLPFDRMTTIAGHPERSEELRSTSRRPLEKDMAEQSSLQWVLSLPREALSPPPAEGINYQSHV
jgi:hypothetical protein